MIRYPDLQDHAPGSILVEEAGGKITDSEGAPLRFGLGRGMGENRGFVATVDEELHGRVLSAIKRAQFTEDAEKPKATPQGSPLG
jgi:3'(2'), 5'-bisphosphate nucleotidase